MLFMSCVCHAPASVFCCVVVTCLKGVTSWLSFVMFYCVFVTFLCGILGQVWNLIVSIPDLATFLTFLQNMVILHIKLKEMKYTKLAQ